MKVQLRTDYQAPAVEQVREVLSYCPETGALTWKQSRGKATAGAPAGCADHRGYQVVGLLGKRHYAHRLAILLATGEWPSAVVDHINGDRADNRLCNLRVVPVLLNAQNRHVPAARSKTQLLGVRKFGKRYRSAIHFAGRQVHLGTFDTPEQAYEAYLVAKRKNHEGCTL